MYCGNYVSEVLDFNTVIWWHCYDANTTEISDIPEGGYTRESQKPTKKRRIMSGSKDILFVVYITTEDLIASRPVFFQEFNDMTKKHHMKKVLKELSFFRK